MDETLAELIESQIKDSKARKIPPENHIISMPSQQVAAIADKIADKHCREPIGWGMPTKIWEAKTTKKCPNCWAEVLKKNGTSFQPSRFTPLPIDISFRIDWEVINFDFITNAVACCESCGFAF